MNKMELDTLYGYSVGLIGKENVRIKLSYY